MQDNKITVRVTKRFRIRIRIFKIYCISPLILLTKSKSFGKIVRRLACTHVSIECSNRLTRYVSDASWSAKSALD